MKLKADQKQPRKKRQVLPSRFTKGSALTEIAQVDSHKQVLNESHEDEQEDPLEKINRQIEQELLIEGFADQAVEDMELGDYQSNNEEFGSNSTRSLFALGTTWGIRKKRSEAFGASGRRRRRGVAFGAVPPPPASMASGASVLRSAGLASPGSWTQRNVLQAGAASAYSRRLAGDATEADFAVLRAARPGITSSLSGPISSAWTKAPWQPAGGLFVDFIDDDKDDLDEDDI